MENKHPMKWHKFLIYFSLWGTALMNIIITPIGIYSSLSHQIRRDYPVFYGLTIVFILLCISLGILAVITRFALADYRRKGPRLLVAMYVCTALLPILFNSLFSLSLGGPLLAPLPLSDVYSCVVSLVMAGINAVYYKKRTELFTY